MYYTMVQTIYKQSSDHSPVIIMVQNKTKYNDSQPGLTNKSPNLRIFKKEIKNSVSLDVRLKSKSDIDEMLELYSNTKYYEESPIKRNLFVHTDFVG